MNATDVLHECKIRFLRHHAPAVAIRQKLRDELGTRMTERNAADEELRGAVLVYRALPDEKKGWLLPVVGLVSLAVVLLEWYPAHLAALTFQGTQWSEIMALTAALALLGAALGDFGGELLRGYRDPAARRPWVHNFFLFLVAVLVVAYLWTGYEMRLAFAIDTDVDYGVSRAAMALGLVVLAALGMLFAAIAVYHAESSEAFALRLKIHRLTRTVRQLTRETEHLTRTFAHVDHECRAAADPIVASVLTGTERCAHHSVDTVRAFLLGDVLRGTAEANRHAETVPHEPAVLSAASNGRDGDNR